MKELELTGVTKIDDLIIKVNRLIVASEKGQSEIDDTNIVIEKSKNRKLKRRLIRKQEKRIIKQQLRLIRIGEHIDMIKGAKGKKILTTKKQD